MDEGASEDGGGEASAGGSADLAARQWAAVQRMAQTERCAVVEYSVLNDGEWRWTSRASRCFAAASGPRPHPARRGAARVIACGMPWTSYAAHCRID